MARRQPTQNEKNHLLQEVNSICPMARCKKHLTEIKEGGFTIDFKLPIFTLAPRL